MAAAGDACVKAAWKKARWAEETSRAGAGCGGAPRLEMGPKAIPEAFPLWLAEA